MTLTASAAALATAFFSMAAVVRRQAEAVRAWNESRQGFTQLCEMDDRTLSDLGLARSDLRDATAAGYFGNPTTILAVRAKERRGHRSAISPVGPSIVPDIVPLLTRRVPSM